MGDRWLAVSVDSHPCVFRHTLAVNNYDIWTLPMFLALKTVWKDCLQSMDPVEDVRLQPATLGTGYCSVVKFYPTNGIAT